MKASVIVVTYNREAVLKYCVEALLSQTTREYEVIVVDDGSTDRTSDLIAGYTKGNAELKHFRNEERCGQPYARNRGIRAAKGNIIIFVDSDVVVHPGFVQDHIDIHENHEKVWLQGMVHHVVSLKQVNFSTYYPNAFCIGAFVTQNVSLPRAWLNKIGGFDESFGKAMGYMDTDLGLRLREIGFKPIHTFFRCKAFHIDGPRTTHNLQAFFDKHRDRGRNAYFFRKRHGKIGKKFAHTEKALRISHVFQTNRWADRGLKSLESLHDSPILPLFPFLRMLMKYHYRAKGIMQAQKEQGLHDAETR